MTGRYRDRDRDRPKLSRKFAATVRKIDGGKCVLCGTFGTVGTRNRLAVHEIAYVTPPTIGNCVTLCSTCHGKITANYRSPLGMLLKIVMDTRRRYVAQGVEQSTLKEAG